MKQSPQELKIAQIVAPVIEDLGFALYCVKIIGEDGGTIVQIMAEDPTTKRLGIDDCAKISRAVSAIMDVEDPIRSAYRLEVSSPGIDRLLITPDHFVRYRGFEAKLETDTPNENGQKRFRGVLDGMNDDLVVMTLDTGAVEIPFNRINKAKLVLSDELIKASTNL